MKDTVAPNLRLAYGASGRTEAIAKALQESSLAASLLVSYVYLEAFLENQKQFLYRDWVLDSGAFSAHYSGKPIDLKAYTERCQQLLAEDKTLVEVFALDVIGDHRASIRNCEYMWDHGVEAIPCFHRGSPEDALLHIAKTYPKIAIGGVALLKGARKMDFAQQCFARVWPKPIHGFGFGAEKQVLALPWHSVDATNWELGPTKFGRWQKYGKLSVRGSQQNLRSEVEFYLSLERRARAHWRKEMALLATLSGESMARS
jgi:hypothetical protein